MRGQQPRDAPNLNISLLLRKNFKEKLKFKYYIPLQVKAQKHSSPKELNRSPCLRVLLCSGYGSGTSCDTRGQPFFPSD